MTVEPTDGFKQIAVVGAGPSIEESGIADLEIRHGRRVPANLRAFLLWRNGGTPIRER